MIIVVCSSKHEKEIFDYIKQKRPNYTTQEFKKIYVVVDDREGVVDVIDNREGQCEYHKFNFSEYMMYHEQLILDAAKKLYPEGDSK